MASGCFVLLLLLMAFLFVSQVGPAQPGPACFLVPSEPGLWRTPISSAQQAAPSPRPSFGLCSMCFARGALPSPLQITLQHCLAFPIPPKQERRKKGLSVLTESFGGVALQFALIVWIRWDRLKSSVWLSPLIPQPPPRPPHGGVPCFPKGWFFWG